MLDWIQTHSTLISAGVQILTAAVWIVYLQYFVTSYRRQTRSNILINRIAGNHDRAHLLVGNMGAEPIYISAVMVEPKIDGQSHCAIVTEDLYEEGETTAVSASRQGPLKSAETRDIGALGDLLDRALSEIGVPDASRVEEVAITVAAEGTYDRFLVAGAQTYWVHHAPDQRRFLPTESQTRQIRSRRGRRALSLRLNAVLRDEADAVRRSGDETGRSQGTAGRATA